MVSKFLLYVTPAVLFSTYDFLLLMYVVLYAKESPFLCCSVHIAVLSDHYMMPRYGKEVNKCGRLPDGPPHIISTYTLPPNYDHNKT
jgi:hypothetical protein